MPGNTAPDRPSERDCDFLFVESKY
ncbi:hypothetical protein AGR6A_Lc120116 [Agrobacterium sp. NCPPB 925]|nr:hypothetical protein AGR6A_Lc120116 [Agrobacterium sp. NCPPB 925]